MAIRARSPAPPRASAAGVGFRSRRDRSRTPGSVSKLLTGTGVGICHSIDFERHGFASAGSRTKTIE